MKLFTIGKKAKSPKSSTAAYAHATERSRAPMGFFEQLKVEERKLGHKKRARFYYEANYTMALALPFPDKRLNLKQENDLIALARPYIIEHANRRVDLFFYTLVAYYQTQVIPTEGHTSLQHGIGRTLKNHTNITQACHSSIIPSLLDETIYHKDDTDIRQKSLLSGTHFLESLNATIELPPFVNAFDDLLEHLCRPYCIELLGEVAVGTLNPIQGLTLFLEMMNDLLHGFQQQAAQSDYTYLEHPLLQGHHYVNPELIDTVLKGTLASTLTPEGRVNEEYIQSLLRMTPAERVLCRKAKGEKIYCKKMMAMKNEILTTESEEHSCTI